MTRAVGPQEAATQAEPRRSPTSGGDSAQGGTPGGAQGRPGAGPDPRGTRANPVRPEHRRSEPGSGGGGQRRPDWREGGPLPKSEGTRPGPRPGAREPAARPQPAASQVGRVRRARLRAVRLDPWSVMKTAFLLSIAFAIVSLVAVTIVWQVLDASGVFSSINDTVGSMLGSAGQADPFDIEDFVGLRRVLGITSLICVVNVVLLTAIATLGAFLYNLSASLLGGVEVTLAEDE